MSTVLIPRASRCVLNVRSRAGTIHRYIKQSIDINEHIIGKLESAFDNQRREKGLGNPRKLVQLSAKPINLIRIIQGGVSVRVPWLN